MTRLNTMVLSFTFCEHYDDALADISHRLTCEERKLAAIYTQTNDVETEANRLMTYDCEVIKLTAEQIRDLNLTMYESDTP